MNQQLLFQFLDSCRLGVLSSLGPEGAPQSALVGIAVTPELKIVFDTVEKSRKFANLGRDRRVAFVVGGWQGEITVQYEGMARRISSTELGPYHEIYFRKFTDGPATEVGRHHLLRGYAEMDSLQRLPPVPAGDSGIHVRMIQSELFLIRIETTGGFAA